MSQDFTFEFEGIDGLLDDPVDQASFARVWIALGERVLTRCAGRRGLERDYVKLPLYRLALGLAENWWALLHESWRQELSPARAAVHQLNAYTSGFVFPAVALWSAGDEAITVTTGAIRTFSPDLQAEQRIWSDGERKIAAIFRGVGSAAERDLATTSFVDQSRERVTVPRGDVETQLFKLVAKVTEWVSAETSDDEGLWERWSRVVEAMNDPAQTAYCVAAGRLGFDPFDERTPDLSVFASHLPEESFDDLCEAAPFDELGAAAEWVAREQDALKQAPELDVRAFGEWPQLDAGQPAWKSGYRAALALRKNLGLAEDPHRASQELFTSADRRNPDEAPPAVEGLLTRSEGKVRRIVVARSSSQQRFRDWRAAYLGWGAEPGSYPLLTTATTYRQQASRAFAAEMLCPVEFLRGRAGRHGLTSDQLNDIAEFLDCAPLVVKHQAENHGIPMRGVY